MMRTSRILAIGVIFCVFVAAPQAFAHDGEITIDLNLDSGVYDWAHNELDPPENDVFKGWATVNVTNTGADPWGDFHFEIYDPIGGMNISNVSFLDTVGFEPTSSQSSLTWIIDNDVVGATVDLYFYSDPVMPGEQATFSVYTDNPDHLSWFGLKLYPTPVPEPATMTLLGLGAIALFRKRK